MNPMFFCVPNLATDRCTASEKPWEDFKIPPEVFELDKEAYKKRYFDPNTRHCLFHLARGSNPDFAVSVGNEASELHGFCADYDGVLTNDLVETLLKHPQSRKYKPAYWCLSQSRKLHLVWLFERPIPVVNNAHANHLLKIVAMKVKAAKWGVGYDPSSESVTQVMDIGREWHDFSAGARILADELAVWDAAIFSASVRSFIPDVVEIDIRTVADEVRKRKWPHDPPMDFSIGKRCVRFWDPSADNQTGAQIVKDGIRVYTPHDNGFKSWKSLLGSEFCEQYTAHSTAPFLADTWYCHSKDEYWRFFRNDVPPHYEKRTEKVLKRDLKTEARMSDKVPKGEELSEIDRTLYTISRKNAVDCVAPVLYRKSGKIEVPGMGWVLNTSLVTVAKPAPRLAEVTDEMLTAFPDAKREYKENPSLCRWDNPFAVVNFPHIHRLLTTVFMKSQKAYIEWEREGFPLVGEKLSDRQLMFFISWLSHFYRTAARMPLNPGRGQVLILAGAAGTGKTFIGRFLLGALMGGETDGSEYYLKGSRFNSGIVSAPVHWIDDKLGSKSHKDRLRFTEMLKVMAANATMRYEAKFGSAVEAVPWPGRIVVISNDDAQSMSVLPDLDMSTRDKFMMLKFGGARFSFGGFADNMKWLHEELPYFARFLLGWEIPADMRDARFGVRAIQHADMAQASAENGLTQVTLEVIETCIESVTSGMDQKDAGDAAGWVVEGNAVKIYKWIQSVDPALGREVVDSRTLQQSLSTLWKNGGYNIGYDEALKRWKIPYEIRRKADSQLTPTSEI